jgi:hypothetical protein
MAASSDAQFRRHPLLGAHPNEDIDQRILQLSDVGHKLLVASVGGGRREIEPMTYINSGIGRGSLTRCVGRPVLV